MGKRKRNTKETGDGSIHLPKRTKTAAQVATNPAALKAQQLLQLARASLAKQDHFAEQPTQDDRTEEGALYDLLGSEDPDDRVDAAGCIITRLLGGSGASQAVLERHLDKRLFRGLASGRNASRIGFSLVITEILSQLFGEKALAASRYPSLRFESTLKMLVERTEPGPNVSGPEERDNYFGRLFGLETFVKAGILRYGGERWSVVLHMILALAAKKVWIRSQCAWLVVQAIGSMDESNAQRTLETLARTEMVDTAEGVAAWLAVRERFPAVKVEPWKDPLAGKRLLRLSTVLREITREESKDEPSLRSQPKQPNWTAQLHFVWDSLIRYVVSTDADSRSVFWQTVIDGTSSNFLPFHVLNAVLTIYTVDGFFSKTASDGQKYRGFMIFQTALQAFAAKGELPLDIFSAKMMACLMNQAAKEDRYLHRAALKVLKGFEGLVSSSPELVLPVLNGLLGPTGDFAFDQRTHTKTVDKINSHVRPEDEKTIVKMLRKRLLTSLK